MGIAMGDSPDEVVAAIGWRRPADRGEPEPQIDTGRAMLGPAAIGLAALAPMVIVGVSAGLGALLVVLATALAGFASPGPVSNTHWPAVLTGSIAVVVAAALAVQSVSFGVRIGAAVLGLMLSLLMAAVVTESSSEGRGR
jgi:hypothetical protein